MKTRRLFYSGNVWIILALIAYGGSEALFRVLGAHKLFVLLGRTLLKVKYTGHDAQNQDDFQEDEQELFLFHVNSWIQMKDGKSVLHL